MIRPDVVDIRAFVTNTRQVVEQVPYHAGMDVGLGILSFIEVRMESIGKKGLIGCPVVFIILGGLIR